MRQGIKHVEECLANRAQQSSSHRMWIYPLGEYAQRCPLTTTPCCTLLQRCNVPWHPTPVLLPGKSHGQRSLPGSSVHGVAKSRTRLTDFTFTFYFHALEKEMATGSSVLLSGESQGQGSLVGCRLWGHTESDTTEVT